jgi:hypothetical protein
MADKTTSTSPAIKAGTIQAGMATGTGTGTGVGSGCGCDPGTAPIAGATGTALGISAGTVGKITGSDGSTC